ncbi:MAG: FAD-dependent oxidoreductase [Planctomycetota bacterium]|nr:FAD-dependent oxidoreductase [Planctomycetota bacterium]
MSQRIETCDVVIIGGGPAGSTAALVLARSGARVIVVEKTKFPRFHIGESFIPHNFKLIQRLGLEASLRNVAHVPKYGAELVMGDGKDPIRFDFVQSLGAGGESFNLERAPFDEMLLTEARRAGADVREQVTVKQILSLTAGDVRVTTDAGDELRGKFLVDASGHGTVVGRHLGLRRTADEPHLRKTAYFNHFDGVWRPPGREEGHPLIVMMDEGWFWIIPLNETKTSVGLVMDPDIARRVMREEKIPADQMLAWAIPRCPAVRDRMKMATGPATNHVLADFSYRCRPYAGDGYFMVGDAAAFMDPVFSTGVCVAMTEAAHTAEQIKGVLAGSISLAKARRSHIAMIEGSTKTLFRIIGQYYDHSFRELFLQGTGPLQVHRAVIGVLAGNVFPKPPWPMRWRLWVFGLCVRVNRFKQLAPRRARFSLLATNPLDEAAAMPVGEVAATRA